MTLTYEERFAEAKRWADGFQSYLGQQVTNNAMTWHEAEDLIFSRRDKWIRIAALGYSMDNQRHIDMMFQHTVYVYAFSLSEVYDIPADIAVAMGDYFIGYGALEDRFNLSKFFSSAVKEADAARVTELVRDGLTGTQAVVAAVQGEWFIKRATWANSLDLGAGHWWLMEEEKIDLGKVKTILTQQSVPDEYLFRLLMMNFSIEEVLYAYNNYTAGVMYAYTGEELRSITIDPKIFNRIFAGASSLDIHATVGEIERAASYGFVSMKTIREHGHTFYVLNHQKATFTELLDFFIEEQVN